MPSGSNSPIHFFSEGLSFQLDKPKSTRQWLVHLADYHGFNIENLNYIFCTDPYLLDINQRYLDHDTYTDIITFDYSAGNLLNGEIYISIDRVKENANDHDESVNDELHRVMAHGLLHLMGFKDKSAEEQQAMRAAEDFCLNLRTF